MTRILRERAADRFWTRHSNPKSGWSRVPSGPLLVLAIYRRDWRLLVATLCWAVVNPVLFPPPDDEDAWMTRAVLAERWWLRGGNRTVGLAYPNICNAAGATGFLVALVAAWRRRPAAAAVGTVASIGLKLQWLRALVRRYDERERD